MALTRRCWLSTVRVSGNFISVLQCPFWSADRYFPASWRILACLRNQNDVLPNSRIASLPSHSPCTLACLPDFAQETLAHHREQILANMSLGGDGLIFFIRGRLALISAYFRVSFEGTPSI